MRSFDRPSAASGSGRSTPGIRKVPTGRLMAFVSLLRRGRLAGRFPSIPPKQDAYVAYRLRPASGADPRCGNLFPHGRRRPFPCLPVCTQASN